MISCSSHVIFVKTNNNDVQTTPPAAAAIKNGGPPAAPPTLQPQTLPLLAPPQPPAVPTLESADLNKNGAKIEDDISKNAGDESADVSMKGVEAMEEEKVEEEDEKEFFIPKLLDAAG